MVQTWAKCCPAELGLGLSVAHPDPRLTLNQLEVKGKNDKELYELEL